MTTLIDDVHSTTTNITLKQPKSLYLLFFTELWERFGFYTVQTIIILYMTKALFMSDQKANLLYAAFSSLLYLTPMLGGYLADRYLGFQRTIIFGGLLFVIAYIITAFRSDSMFFLGLSVLICANGFFKPSVSSIVGDLYHENDPRRDGGFTIFYMGINVGALIPPLIAGALVTHYGWHSGFLVAAVGMLLGQITFMWGKKYLGDAGLKPKHKVKMPLGKIFYLLLFSGTLLTIFLCRLALNYPEITNFLIEISAAVILLIVCFFLFKEPLAQRKKMFACLILIIISIAFWSLYNQAFTSLMLFADRNMSKQMLGISIDAEVTQFFNPLFIILLSPLLSRLWIRMDQGGLNPSTQIKFALGILLMSGGYLLLAFGTQYFSIDGLSSPWWLCASYFLQTVGELLVSPIGLAMITVLCPKHLTGLMMGVWFFSEAASFAIGGMLANIAATPEKLAPLASLPFYHHAFTLYGLISLIAAIGTFALIPFLNRLTRGENARA
jgi:POT family proton-dependent oligopeptide transporter